MNLSSPAASSDPSTKYDPYPLVPFPEGYVRRWPTQRATVSPTWLSTDLRDGNQALINPMNNVTKLELFRSALSLIGFKEIEVAYPSAADTEFNFVRSLIENNEVPDDVSLQIITPARADLIERSIASLAGAKKAIIHLYNAVSPLFREVVFRNSKEQTIDLTLNAVKLVKKLTEKETARSGTHFRLNYCFETFSQTEPDFAVELGNRVLEEWGKARFDDDRVTFNLAATVECAPSNHYADMVEYFCNNINQREKCIISIHPHNDRGTAVAATELALLAGGDRVEGCLLGNGERTGNVDLITVALNLYSQGVSPNLDFSDLPEIVKTVARCNEMSLPQRYPYSGALVFTAFAGTHQDAIKKGLDLQRKRWEVVDNTGAGRKTWAVPYIPLDPKDLGYGYENLIRVSSQSGKAGAAYIIKEILGFDIPRRMQVAFYNVVQQESERSSREMTAKLVSDAFRGAYGFLPTSGARLRPGTFEIRPASPTSAISDDGTITPTDLVTVIAELFIDGKSRTIQGRCKSPIGALRDALYADLGIELDVGERVFQKVGDEGLATYIEVTPRGKTPSKSGAGSIWGVGLSANGMESECQALIRAASNIVPTDVVFRRPKMIFAPRSTPGYPMPTDYSSHIRAGRAASQHGVQSFRSSTPEISLQG
ncbi:2-isopropylmalate synthase [Vararia minispora EC-137]|uniref:2-isopropylmalate synthase n=1 Tax=Vararia minispora EC-137 TaxID=1314806 RepID=A0ACB8QER2_9AGAM|nr:2-isopropylmalate synthase [Vararia minispora EC-137]